MSRTTNKVLFSSLLLLLIVVADVGAQETNSASGLTAQPRIVCTEPNFDFGRVIGTNEVTHAFRIANEGDASLNIIRIHAGCGCTEAKAGSDSISARSSTDLTVRFKTAGRAGPQRKSIYVHSNDPQSPILRLEMSGDIVVPRGISKKAGDDLLQGTEGKRTPRGDFYATPDEIVFVALPGQTNTLTRFVAVRSLSGKVFKVVDVTLPCPGNAEITDSLDAAGCLIKLSGLVPLPGMDGKAVTIRMQDGTFLSVPLLLKKRPAPVVE